VPVAFVTCGSSGIGAAIARALRGRSWDCVLLARGEERLRPLAAELGAEWELCDVGDREAVDRVAAAVLERHPRLELLVNNAGVPGRGRFVDVDPDTIERVTRINYLGGVWCLRAFLPGLQAHGDAHVVNVVSVAGTISFAPAGPYSASKHAQLAFSRSTAAALAGTGVRVHTVLPGFVETEGFPQRAVLQSRLMRRFVIDAPRVAEAVADSVDKGRREVTVPWFPYRFVSLAQALAPGLVARFIGMSRERGEP
jgi:uncharacterized protein